MNLRRNWANYYVEMSLIFGMLIYFLAFLLGRSKNSTLAQAWYKANKELLESNFSIVGELLILYYTNLTFIHCRCLLLLFIDVTQTTHLINAEAQRETVFVLLVWLIFWVTLCENGLRIMI